MLENEINLYPIVLWARGKNKLVKRDLSEKMKDSQLTQDYMKEKKSVDQARFLGIAKPVLTEVSP